jgi:predicted amidohydrolase
LHIMKSGWQYFMLGLLIVVFAYFTWAETGSLTHSTKTYTGKMDMRAFSADSDRGNIVSISPYMYPEDYASEESYYQALDRYMQAAAQKGWLHKNTVVSFPEYIGTWLVIAGEKKGVFTAATVKDAMALMAESNLFYFLPKYITAEAGDKAASALFRMKAKKMARLNDAVFGELAKHYGVTIVSGSIVLPEPEVKDGRIEVHEGRLFNVSLVYHPDGKPDEHIVKKAFPIADELVFTCKADAANLPVFQTPAGKMAVLVCADSWYADCYRNAADKHADFVIVPSYVEGDSGFQKPWPGYSGFANPSDVDKNDVQKITVLDAWERYALPARMKQAGLQNGIITYLHGKFWDLGADSRIVLVHEGETVVQQPHADASVVCLWL